MFYQIRKDGAPLLLVIFLWSTLLLLGGHPLHNVLFHHDDAPAHHENSVAHQILMQVLLMVAAITLFSPSRNIQRIITFLSQSFSRVVYYFSKPRSPPRCFS